MRLGMRSAWIGDVIEASYLDLMLGQGRIKSSIRLAAGRTQTWKVAGAPCQEIWNRQTGCSMKPATVRLWLGWTKRSQQHRALGGQPLAARTVGRAPLMPCRKWRIGDRSADTPKAYDLGSGTHRNAGKRRGTGCWLISRGLRGSALAAAAKRGPSSNITPSELHSASLRFSFDQRSMRARRQLDALSSTGGWFPAHLVRTHAIHQMPADWLVALISSLGWTQTGGIGQPGVASDRAWQ